jgi:hypothetical protein
MHARRKAGEKAQYLVTSKLLTEHNGAAAICPMRLKDLLRDIQSHGVNLVHGRLLE